MRALALAVTVAAIAAPAAASPSGLIRICRAPGVVGSADRRAIPIPQGSAFTNADDPKTGDELKPHFTLHTAAPVVLPPKPGCVTAPAVLDDAPDGFRLTTRYPSMPSQLSVPGLDVRAKVVRDFH